MAFRYDTQEIQRVLLEKHYKLPSLRGDEEFLSGLSSEGVPVSFIIVPQSRATEAALDLATSLEHPYILRTKERFLCSLGRRQCFILVQEAIQKSLKLEIKYRDEMKHPYHDAELQQHWKGLLEALALLAESGVCHKRIGLDTIFLPPIYPQQTHHSMKLGCFEYCERALNRYQLQEDIFALGQNFKVMRDFGRTQSGPNFYDQMIDMMTRTVHEAPTAQWLLDTFFPVTPPSIAAMPPPEEIPPQVETPEEQIEAPNQETILKKTEQTQTGTSLTIPVQETKPPICNNTAPAHAHDDNNSDPQSKNCKCILY